MANVVAARIGNGIHHLPPIKGYVRSVTIIWRPNSTYTRLSEPESTGNTIGKIHLHRECDDWSSARVIQLLMINDTSALADAEQRRHYDEDSPETPAAPDTDRLSTIPEETEESTSTSTESLNDYLFHSDPVLTQCLQSVPVLPEDSTPLPELQELPEDTGDRLPLMHMIPDYFPTTILPPLTDNYNAFVELSIMQPMTNLIQLEQPRALNSDEMVLLQMTENPTRQEVDKRETTTS